MSKSFSFFVKICVVWVVLGAQILMANDSNNIVAKADDFTITQGEIQLLRSRMKSFFETTEKEYCRALLKIKLFSKEARNAKIDMDPEIAAELNQMIDQKLSDFYINRIVDTYELPAGTVESYYNSHMDAFVGKDGMPIPLDDALNQKIRQSILKAKKSEIANKEMERLVKKHNVEILNPAWAAEGLVQ